MIKSIKKGPGATGFIFGYYDEKTENYFSDKFEKPYGDLIKNLENNANYELTNDDIDFLKSFMINLLNRNPDVLKIVNENTLFKKNGKKFTKNSLPSLIEEIIKDANFLEKEKVILVHNKSSVKFVTSTYGFGLLIPDKDNEISMCHWLLPLTSKFAIIFLPEEEWLEPFKNEKRMEVEEKDKDFIIKLDDRFAISAMYFYEYNKDEKPNIYFICSSDEKELKRVQDYLQKNRRS